jgi:hypothetical protein
MEAISDQLNDLGYFPERRLEYTLDSGTRVDGRPKVLLDNVLDLILLIMNCSFELTSVCLKLS